MKRVLLKIVVPAVLISVWLMVCYPVCKKEEGFDWFLYWILAGCPFGIKRMCVWIAPRNFDIGGSVGILALNFIIGGLIGGFVVIVKALGIVAELVKIIAESLWTKSPKENGYGGS